MSVCYVPYSASEYQIQTFTFDKFKRYKRDISNWSRYNRSQKYNSFLARFGFVKIKKYCEINSKSKVQHVTFCDRYTVHVDINIPTKLSIIVWVSWLTNFNQIIPVKHYSSHLSNIWRSLRTSIWFIWYCFHVLCIGICTELTWRDVESNVYFIDTSDRDCSRLRVMLSRNIT